MANESFQIDPQISREINFTLDVKTTVIRGSVDKIDFKMNLNPDKRLVQIEDHLSSYEDLLAIFKEISRVLREIKERTDAYNEATEINYDIYERYGFQRGYEENIKPTFGKIDKVHHKHESPESSSVTYTKSYNGDKRPK